MNDVNIDNPFYPFPFEDISLPPSDGELEQIETTVQNSGMKSGTILSMNSGIYSLFPVESIDLPPPEKESELVNTITQSLGKKRGTDPLMYLPAPKKRRIIEAGCETKSLSPVKHITPLEFSTPYKRKKLF